MNLYAKATIRTIRETCIRFLYVDLIMDEMRERNEVRSIATIVSLYAKKLKSMHIPLLLYSKAKSPHTIEVAYNKIIGKTKNKAFHKT